MKKSEVFVSVCLTYFLTFCAVYTCLDYMFPITKEILNDSYADALKNYVAYLFAPIGGFSMNFYMTKLKKIREGLALCFISLAVMHAMFLLCFYFQGLRIIKHGIILVSLVFFYIIVGTIFAFCETFCSNVLNQFDMMKYFGYIRISTTIGSVFALLPTYMDKQIDISGKANHKIKLLFGGLVSLVGFLFVLFMRPKFVPENTTEGEKTSHTKSAKHLMKAVLMMLFTPFGLVLLAIHTQGLSRSVINQFKKDFYCNQLKNFDEKKLANIEFVRLLIEVSTYFVIDFFKLTRFNPVYIFMASVVFSSLRPFIISLPGGGEMPEAVN